MHAHNRRWRPIFTEQLEPRLVLAAVPFTGMEVSAPSIGHPTVVEAGDIDFDGDVDIVSYGEDNGELVWIENDGAGAFGSIHPIGSRPGADLALSVADYDGDGRDDVIASDYSTDEIFWYRNEGVLDGIHRFADSQRIAGFAAPSDIDTDDIDRDGDIDIVVVSSYHESVSWFRNDTDATTRFDVPRLADGGLDELGLGVSTILRIEFVEDVVAAKAIVAITGYESVRILELNSGIVRDSGANPDVRSDVLALKARTAESITIAHDNFFVSTTSFPFPEFFVRASSESFSTPTDAVFADVDSDGTDELVYADRTLHQLFWIEVEEQDRFGDAESIVNSIVSGGVPFATMIASGDLTGDSQPEIVVNRPGHGEIVAFNFHDETGGAVSESIAARFVPGSALPDSWFTVADLDGDYTDDIVVQRDELTALRPLSALPADLNGDGKEEFLSVVSGISPASAGSVEWRETPYDLESRHILFEGDISETSSLAAADMDGDGDVDILASLNRIDIPNETDSNVVWFEQESGRFDRMHFVTAAPSGVRSIGAADINGDGELDIYLSAIYDGEVLWYRNLGNAQSFSEDAIAISSQANLVRQVKSVDLDRDGDIDIVTSSQGDGSVYWHENNGVGIFQQRHRIATGLHGIPTFELIDIDDDGDTDVFATDQFNGQLFWYRNELNTADRAGDMNRDAKIDKQDLDLLCSKISGAGANPTAGGDLDHNGVVNYQDFSVLLKDKLRTGIGDSNVDGLFDSKDLVTIFQANEYEDDLTGNSTWSDGDWNCDGDFTTSDLVQAFRSGSFVRAAMPNRHTIAWKFAATVKEPDLERDDRQQNKKNGTPLNVGEALS